MSNDEVRILISRERGPKDVARLHISVEAGASGRVKDNSQLILLNKSWKYPVLVWATRTSNSFENDSNDLIEGWEQLANENSEVRLDQRTREQQLRIKRKGKPFSFWLHVNFGSDAANGDDGGGLAASAEIDVTPP